MYDWSVEVIAQFYATLHFDHEENQTMQRIIEGEGYQIKYRTFGRLFGFDIRDSSKTKIHTE